jgi:hypothetical protein
MGQVEGLADETDSVKLIAPHEVRELVMRLNERSVEGMRFDEPRTLAGLALETGIPTERLRETLRKIQGKGRVRGLWFAAVGGVTLVGGAIGFLYFRRTEPMVATTPIVVRPAPSDPAIVAMQPGLVPATQVPYGPISGNVYVDPSFVPPHPIPPGLGITVTIGNVMWGAGNPHADSITKPFDSAQLKRLREDIVAMLEYARSHAGPLGLKPNPGTVGPPPFPPMFPAILTDEAYSGVGSAGANLPPSGKEFDDQAARVIGTAADSLVDSITNMFEQGQSNRLLQGPH